MKKSSIFLFSSILMTVMLLDTPIVSSETVIYDPLSPSQTITPKTKETESSQEQSEASEPASSESAVKQSTTTESETATTSETQTESSEPKEAPKKKNSKKKISIDDLFTKKKKAAGLDILVPKDFSGSGSSEKMHPLTELAYSLSGLAIYGKDREGGPEINVQDIFG
ncbi:hypothetical protein IGI37_003815 [Enterococcus sp. AZ194]|uniref:hypothetical protein n=1 Tax=Enterococcus sp. AZ194 TaxID=2774629 RepID=UPI003F2049D7